MKVVWTEQAFTRLAEIRAWIAADNPVASDRLVEKQVRRTDALATSPRLGRRVPDLPETTLRELVEGNYRIVYRIAHRRIEVLTVFEGHRFFPVEDVG